MNKGKALDLAWDYILIKYTTPLKLDYFSFIFLQIFVPGFIFGCAVSLRQQNSKLCLTDSRYLMCEIEFRKLAR